MGNGLRDQESTVGIRDCPTRSFTCSRVLKKIVFDIHLYIIFSPIPCKLLSNSAEQNLV
jgi:hypothetical protein